MNYIIDSDLEQIIQRGNVVLVKIDEVGLQLTNLKNDLNEYKNVKLIYENGRNIRAIHQAIDNGQVPVLLMGKTSLQSMRLEVRAAITHVLKPSQYISQEAAELFIF